MSMMSQAPSRNGSDTFCPMHINTRVEYKRSIACTYWKTSCTLCQMVFKLLFITCNCKKRIDRTYSISEYTGIYFMPDRMMWQCCNPNGFSHGLKDVALPQQDCNMWHYHNFSCGRTKRPWVNQLCT